MNLTEIKIKPDPLIEDSVYWNDTAFRIMHHMLYKYNNELPLCVGKCFIRTFRSNILTAPHIDASFCDMFKQFKRQTKVTFEPIRLNGALDFKVRLKHFRILNIDEDTFSDFQLEHVEFNGFYFETEMEDVMEEQDMSHGLRYYSSNNQRVNVTIKIPVSRRNPLF